MEKYFWVRVIETGRVVIARVNEWNSALLLPSMNGPSPLYFTKDEVEILEEVKRPTQL